MEILRYTLLISEFIAFLGSIIYCKYYKNDAIIMSLLPYFLGFVFISEFTAMLSYNHFLQFDVMFITNFQIFVQVAFYIPLFGLNLKNVTAKKITWAFLVIFSSSSLFEFFYLAEDETRLNSISFMLGAMSIIVLSILYIMGSIKNFNENGLLNNTLNWLSISVFPAFAIDLCVFSLTNFYGTLNDHEMNIIYHIYLLRLIFFILMYVLFSLGFVYSKWVKEKL